MEKEKLPYTGIKKTTTVFFIFTCIGLGVVIATLALPVFLAIIGFILMVLWLVILLVTTVFTLGMAWTFEPYRAYNKGFMNLWQGTFNATTTVSQYGSTIIPIAVGISLLLMFITWIFVVIGTMIDEKRHRFYIGHIIALSIISILMIGLGILSIVLVMNK